MQDKVSVLNFWLCAGSFIDLGFDESLRIYAKDGAV